MSGKMCSRTIRTVTGGEARKLINSGKPVAIQFFSPFCAHCEETKPEMEKTQQTLCGEVELVRVNVDTNTSFADEEGVSGMPTLAVYRNGKLVKRDEGSNDAPHFVKMIKKAINSAPKE
jgi:thioredoxin-like negative regulator of GroEL